MSRNGKACAAPAGGWPEEDQQRAWLAYIRVHARRLQAKSSGVTASPAAALPAGSVNRQDLPAQVPVLRTRGVG